MLERLSLKKSLLLICTIFLLFTACGKDEPVKKQGSTSSQVKKEVVESCSGAVIKAQEVKDSGDIATDLKSRNLGYLKSLITGLKSIEIVENKELQADLNKKIKYTQIYLDGLEKLHEKYESTGSEYYKDIEFITDSTELAKELNAKLAGNKIEEYCTISNEELAGE